MTNFVKGMRLMYVSDELPRLKGQIITLKERTGATIPTWEVEEHSGTYTEEYLNTEYRVVEPKEELPHEPKEVYVATTASFYAVGDVLIHNETREKDTIVEIDTSSDRMYCSLKTLNHGWLHDDSLASNYSVYEQVDRALLYKTREVDGKEADMIIFDEFHEHSENWEFESEPVVNVSFDLEGEDKETVTLMSYADGSTLMQVLELNEDADNILGTEYNEVLLDLTINDMKRLRTALNSAIELTELLK